VIYTTEMLKEKYRDYSNPSDKIKRDLKEGKLFHIVRGLYETNRDIDPIFLAGSISSPSYISFDYALSYYGLIPEEVKAITSASLGVRKNKIFTNVFARYEFSDIPSRAFASGLTIIEKDGYYARIASKEKALCDSLYKRPIARSMKDLKVLLFKDKRIDEEAFNDLDFIELLRLASLYDDTNHKTLIKLINRDYIDG
jgi:predicted transcriptional regulator of viral defense system